jgi:hypothetical protein
VSYPLTFGSLLLLAASCGAEPPSLQDDLAALQGDWEPAAARGDKEAAPVRLQFRKQTLLLQYQSARETQTVDCSFKLQEANRKRVIETWTTTRFRIAEFSMGTYRVQGDKFILDSAQVELPLQRRTIDLKGEWKRVPSRTISLQTPNGWYLEIDTDGAGRVGYGPAPADLWGFKPGTFDVVKVNRDLQALKGNEKGTLSTHFLFSFDSEHRGPGLGPPAWYSRDENTILPLFEKAIEAGQVKKQERGMVLLEKHPPGLPKEK